MDSVEPSGLLYTRLLTLDPESASKIMGFVLIHGPNESDMMSLATSPDSVLQQLIAKGKDYSRLLTNSSLNLSDVVKGEDFSVGDGGGGSPRGFHKRSFSVNDASYGGGLEEISPGTGGRTPWKFDGFEQEVLHARATQQHRSALASQIMSGSSLPYTKFLSESPRSKAAAMMMGEEAYKLAQFRNESSEFGLIGCSAGSRQIYLTFPADSMFREEDVSNYFSIYGPVHDVRIPYQQKRMFGFVTFVHPETVKIILAKGNPHFVCDSRVLVKPYKEKGKVEKKHLMTQQQLERGALSSCSSPLGVDIRDFDVPIGPRMFHNNIQDLLLRRKLEEQAEFQQALEMQSRKLADLQLLDLKNLSGRHPFSSNHNLSPVAALSSPTCHPFSSNHILSPSSAMSPPNRHPLLSPNHMRSMSTFSQEAFEENNTTPTLSLPPHALGNRQNSLERYSNTNNSNIYITGNFNEIHQLADSADNESIDLVLPDTLDDTILSRPAAPSRQCIFSSAMPAMPAMNENDTATNSQFTSNSKSKVSSACLSDVALPKSRFLDDPCFGTASNRAIEM